MGKFNITSIPVYDLRGQSNMGGLGDASDDLPAGYQGEQDSQIYYKTTRTSTDDGAWADLTPGTNTHGDPAFNGNDYFGIESKLFKDIADNNGTIPRVIKSSRGGTNIASHFIAGPDGIVSNSYYMTPAISKLVKDGIPEYKSCIWFQGYSDCTADGTANGYAGNLQTWSADLNTFLRTLFRAQYEYNIVVVESPDFADAATTEARVNTVQAAQLAFSSTGRKRYSVAKPSGSLLKVDNIHVTGAGLIAYADQVYNTIRNL